MVNKVQRRKALPADYWKWLPGGDKPLTRKTFSPATSIPSPLLSLICLPFFKTQVPSTLQTVPSASVMSFVMGIILPLVIIIMRPSFIKTQSPMGWPLLSTILPFCIVHSITSVLGFAQTAGWIANRVRLRITATLPTRDKMSRPPRKALGSFLCSIRYPKNNSSQLYQFVLLSPCKNLRLTKICSLQRLRVSSLAEQPHVYELAQASWIALKPRSKPQP